MVEGNMYYYLTVPRNAEWMGIGISEEPKQYNSSDNWENCVSVEEHDTLGLYALNQLIRDLKDSISAYYDMSPSKGWKPSGSTEKAWWVSASKASDVRSITIQNASEGVNPNKSNCFKTEEEAKGLQVVIRTVMAKHGIQSKGL